ncbi:MAG: hypothetical protein ACYC4H_08855 [Desulfocucumaceae bacterium]
MSCYLRHLKGVMSRAGVEPSDKGQRRAVDLAVREIVGAGDIPCGQVWKTVKEWIADPAREELLVSELKRKLKDQ